jgi:excisionase family DNA binding protein
MIQMLTPDEIRAEIRAVVREELRAARGAGPSTPALLSVADAAKRLGVHQRTIRRRIKSGELPAVRVGRCVRIDANLLLPPDPMVERLARAARAA